IVYVLTSGCAWRHLPPSFGVSVPTAHRRVTTWARAGVFDELHRQVLDRLGAGGDLGWSAAIFAPHTCGRKRGLSDRPQPGRPRQERLEDPPFVRRRRHAARHRGDLSKHPRQCHGQCHAATQGGRDSRGAFASWSVAAGPAGCGRTKATTIPYTAGGCGHGASSRGSRAAGSAVVSASAVTGGRSNAPWRG